MKKMAYMSWWITVLTLASFVLYEYLIGTIPKIVANDSSHVTLLLGGIVLLSTLYFGIAARKLSKRGDHDMSQVFRFGRFVEDLCLRLGLLGTVIGCMVLFATKMNFDIGDAAKSMQMLGGMSSALGIVFGSTYFGIGSSIIIKTQHFILQRFAS